MIKRLWLVFLALIVTSPAMAAVVFETTFDDVPSWNASTVAEDACWQNTGVAGGASACTRQPWGAGTTWVDANTIWNDYRILAPHCGTIYASHIGNATDIEAVKSGANFTPYGGTGKSYVHFYEPCLSGSGSYGSDGLIGVYFGKTTGHQELYVQAKIKWQAGWTYASGGNQQKLIHIAHFDEYVAPEGLQAYNWFTYGSVAPNSPDAVYTIYRSSVYESGHTQLQLGWVPTDGSQCMDVPCGGTTVYPLSSNIADGNWHTIKYRVKLNSAANQADGVQAVWVDGTLVKSRTNVPWTLANEPTVTRWGFNRVVIGGNSDNIFGSSGQSQWFAVDNLVVSTTDIADDYVPGGGSTGPSTSISGVSMSGGKF